MGQTSGEANDCPALRLIAHELRNDLAVIAGNLELLANGHSNPSKPFARAFAALEQAKAHLDELSRMAQAQT